MKTAVHLFGHYRNFRINIEKLEANLENYEEFDFFLHTWDVIDHNTISWYGQNNTKKFLDNNDIKVIKKIKNLKSYFIDEQINVDEKFHLFKNGSVVSNDSIFFPIQSMKFVSDMSFNFSKEKGFEYEISIFLRLDVTLKRRISVLKIIESVRRVQGNTTSFKIIPTGPYINDLFPEINEFVFNDLFFFGDYFSLRKYSEYLYKSINEFNFEKITSVGEFYAYADLFLDIKTYSISYYLGKDWDHFTSIYR